MIALICGSCGSAKLRTFTGEVSLHVPGFQNIDVPTVYVAPTVLVCADCGNAQFVVPETELHTPAFETALDFQRS